MTAKLVSIRTRSGDDLTPVPSCYHVQTISQRQAILAFRNNSKSTIWPAVKARMSDASIRATQPRIRISAAWIRAILLVVAATAASCAIIWWTL